ncbi:MAG TPA: SRPBCC family protein [Acidimicrobiia bacterium]
MRLQEQRTVLRGLDEVFAYTADFSNIENWDPGVARSAKVGVEAVGVGTRFDLDVKFGSRIVPMTYEVTVYEPPKRVVLVGTGDTVGAIDEIRFSSQNGRTIIDYTADIEFRNFIRFLTPFMGSTMRKVGERALDGLVTALDG